MPRLDKIIWFAVAPGLVMLAASVFPGVREHPEYALLDAWLLVALGTWIARRRYVGWAVKFRWSIPVIWLVRILVAAEAARAALARG